MMINKLKELEKIINDFEIDKNDVCIVGSSVLTYKSIRLNNDLEFILNPKVRKKIKKKIKTTPIWSQNEIYENVEYFKNFYGFCGISDKKIFENKLFYESDGFYIAIIELEYIYKIELIKMMKRKKDIDDLLLLDKFDTELKNKKKVFINKYSNPFFKYISKFVFKVLCHIKKQ